MDRRGIATLALVTLGWGALLFCLPSCSKPPSWTAKEWREGDGPELAPPSLGEDGIQSKLGRQHVEFREQTVAGVPVQGSFFKTLKTGDIPNWARGRYLEERNLPSVVSVRQELKRKDKIDKRLERLSSRLGCKLGEETNSELRWKGSWQLVFKRTCENKSGEVWELVVSSRGKWISRAKVGAALSSTGEIAMATLFPKGPKQSQLKLVAMRVAAAPNYLDSPSVEVVSDAGAQILDLNQLQSTHPSDGRFDMLQAYYYSLHSLDWVAQNLKFQLQGLKIRTQVGYPEKSNVAFYYAREVRLGSGDDVTFSHLAWDPSVVIHETMHGVIDALTHLPLGTGEGGSLQEGLADTLTALQLDNPLMGEASYLAAPFERTLDNDAKLSAKTGGLYHDSLILSGTLWEIKQKVGEATCKDLTRHLLAHLVPSSDFADVSRQFQSWLADNATNANKDSVATILQTRGWL